MDSLDAKILLALDDDPDATVLALAARLGIARNTLTSRLQRMRESGTVRDFARRVDPALLGRGMVAFISLEISQHSAQGAIEALRAVPEVIEMHSTTGDADLLLKVVARDTADLHRLTGEIVLAPGVVRTGTVLSLNEEMPLRLRALIEEIARE
ncbi:Lrp/AsnC family transcriptional regulator [Actinocorallia aurea]